MTEKKQKIKEMLLEAMRVPYVRWLALINVVFWAVVGVMQAFVTPGVRDRAQDKLIEMQLQKALMEKKDVKK